MAYVALVCFLLMANYVYSPRVASSPSPERKHDIFVSFRGKDIRRGFLSHLTYAFSQKHIDVFVDDQIEKGEEIWPSLLKAIEGSLISLVIFSENFASSRWCLDELLKIMECKEKSRYHVVVPVFYNIDPADVRHQRGAYEAAFIQLEERHSWTKLDLWRVALKECSNLLGFHSSSFR